MNQLNKLTSDLPITRNEYLARKIVFIDGLAGCGKTMLSPIISAFDRVEILNYAYEIEYICSLYYLNKISTDAAYSLIRIFTDLKLYNTMMSRETNFRISDLSSVFKDARPLRYVKRLFVKGDELVPSKIQAEQPILSLTTHNLLSFSEPIFKSLNERVIFIEVVRHPLYMIKQQTLNMESLVADVRDFTIYFSYKGLQLPYYVYEWKDLFISSNSVERAVYYIEKLTQMTENFKRQRYHAGGKQIITIQFETFVLNPYMYIRQIEEAVGTSYTKITEKMMKKQNVPRKKIADGIALAIYKRCGWKAPQKGLSEREELDSRREALKNKVSRDALAVLDRISSEYEQKYFAGRISNGQ
ncbi:MAG: hypothetical protein GF384_06255 [Elusimicrobia bacterium]|nr:hypothetical protein [Elusimicrobiota bacterium]